MALIGPAKSNSEVIIQAVAARDRTRAEAFAKTHGIPEVRDSYQEILDDPNIDAVFIPLPNSLHFEWAVRSIRAGKHVLVEKPCVNTHQEAEFLFNLPELSGPDAPVLLEAAHNRFHPSMHKFMSFVSPADVVHVHTDSMVPGLMVGKDGIHFNYAMGGGSIMMLGCYNFAILRMIFGAEPEECLSCDPHTFGDGVHDKCDTDVTAKFRFPNGGIGEAFTTLQGSILWKPSEARVTHREVAVPSDGTPLPVGQTKYRTRVVTLHGFVHAVAWHRIDVQDTFVIRNEDRSVVKQWVEKTSHKAYTYDAEGAEPWKMSYHHQLEAFVNRIKGQETRYWIEGQDSIDGMRMVDMAYEKSGLGLRPSSEFR
jgi:predicted dehydrogenase